MTLGTLGAALGLWGAIGSAGYVVVGVATLLGAASAAGTLAIARQSDDAQLLEQAEKIGEIGLSKDEARELLG